MAKLSIIKIYRENYAFKNFCLNRQTEKVLNNEFNTEQLNGVVNNMLETLYESSCGVGLAANQVGIMKQICIFDFKRDGKKPIVCINPHYVHDSDERIISREQCMSFPNVSVTLERYKKVNVFYQNLNGEKRELTAEGFKAVVFQHEIDHLNGRTFIDYDCKIEEYIGYPAKIANNAMEVLGNE